MSLSGFTMSTSWVTSPFAFILDCGTHIGHSAVCTDFHNPVPFILQKYFDSGDYQMAKQTGNLQPGRRGNGKPPLVQTGATGQAHPTPASMPHRKVSSEVSKLAV